MATEGQKDVEPAIKVKSSRRQTLDAFIDFMGGTAGGVASVYVGQPLDTVKVKMQTFPNLYKNALTCFVKTYRNEGIARGLYAGTVPSLAAQVSENAILFLFYGLCQKAVMRVTGTQKEADLSILQKAWSGFFAAFFSSLSLCPTELVKCRLQAMNEMRLSGKLEGSAAKQPMIGPWGLTKQILREEGIRGMFKGLTPTFAREMPGYFFFFGGYELSREFFTPPGKSKDEIGAVKTVISGGIGGVALWVAIFPADVVKSRFQVMTQKGASPSFVNALVTIARTEGIAALYKGVGPSVLRTFPATGALFLAYETTKKWMTRSADYYEIS